MPYKVRPIDLNLATAGVNVDISEFGNRIQLGSVSAANANITVTVSGQDNVASGPFKLLLNDWVEFPEGFDRIRLNWPAQAGVTCQMMVVDMDPAPQKFDYYQSSRGTIDSIVSTVTVAVESGSNLNTGQVSATTAVGGTLVIAANPNRKVLTLVNNSSSQGLYIGNTGLTSTTGHTFRAGDTYNTNSKAAFYALSPGPSPATVTYMEEVV